MLDHAKRDWVSCTTCGHLHLKETIGLCKSACCATSTQPIAVRHCPQCDGEGQVMDQLDDDRHPVVVRCYPCKGLGVIPVVVTKT